MRYSGYTDLLLGYNSNGFAHHRLSDCVSILRELGYQSIALTLCHHQLDPPDRRGVSGAIHRIEREVSAAGLDVTIETGARFILDPRRKHHPALVSRSAAGRAKRIGFLKAAVDVAAAVGADSVAIWSGAADDNASENALQERLTGALSEVLAHAESAGVRLSFEPEPGMFIDTMARFQDLMKRVNHPLLGLTLDIGHVHCLNDGNLRDHIRRWRHVLWNVHLDDMRRNVHEHLMFGEGEVDFDSVFDALFEVDYAGPVHVELPRHSHNAVETARLAHEFLTRCVN